jgi:DNA-binding transcriptional ArsR family regulator
MHHAETPSPALLGLVAGRFRALAEPARLGILHTLRGGACTVSELVSRTGMAQANVSKHLQVLRSAGFVARRREGLFSWYALADERALALCELMCDRLADDAEREQAVVQGRPAARP